MSAGKTSSSSHFPPSVSHSKASLPKKAHASQALRHFSQLSKQSSSPHFPLDTQKYLICNRTISPSTELITDEKQGKLRSCHRPGYSLPVSPTNISAHSSVLPHSLVPTPHRFFFQGRKYSPVLLPAVSTNSPSLYAITKYMRTRTDLPSGLAGWRQRNGDKVIRAVSRKMHKNKLIDAFLRRFEKKE